MPAGRKILTLEVSKGINVFVSVKCVSSNLGAWSEKLWRSRRVRTQEAKIKLGTNKESWQIQLDWFFCTRRCEV